MTDGRCRGCLEKMLKLDRCQEKIRRLEQENRSLRRQIRREHRKTWEEPFGSSTPSAKRPVKSGATEENRLRRGGAVKGHDGRGRSGVDSPAPVRVPAPGECPHCCVPLVPNGTVPRSVIDLDPARLVPIRYEAGRGRCPRCGRTAQAQVPGVLPRALFGNALLAQVATEHYLHGHTLGDVSRRLGIQESSLHHAMHHVAGRLEPILPGLLADYRAALVRHADETPWRTDGVNGYAWLFCSRDTSIFRLRETRAAIVPQEVLGSDPLPGVLVVDRYAGYNRAPCLLQYCYAHLMRDVGDLLKEFPDDPEVAAFTNGLIPLLAKAMGLRKAAKTPRSYRRRAIALRERIVAICDRSARHPGIQQIQGIFREKADRLYHWVDSWDVPPDNNFAERELRGLVIARKISYGSQSERGRRTRETMMTIIHTLAKRSRDPTGRLKAALDRLVEDQDADLRETLFPCSSQGVTTQD